MVSTPPHPFRSVRGMAALAAALLAAGCLALGPDFEPPAWDGPEAWTAAPDAPPPSPIPDGAPWWSVFGDGALDALEEALLAQSPTLAASVARLDAASAQLGIARADGWPSANLSASSRRGKQTLSDESGDSATGTAWLHTANLTLRWELDFWGRVRRNTEAARADLSAAACDLQTSRTLLSLQAAAAYITLRTLQSRLDCALRNEALQSSTLALVRSRHKAGLDGELELSQAQMNLAATRAEIPVLRSQIDATHHALCALASDWPGARDTLRAPAPVPTAPPTALPDTLPADLLRTRPDVAAAIHRLHAETARIGAAKADLFPKVTIDGTFGISAARLFEGEARTWGIGPSIEWPVFAAGRLLCTLRAQQAAARAAEADLRQAILDAAAECETALSAHRAALSALDAHRAAAAAAARSAELAGTQYRHGLVPFRDVLDMQTRLSEHQNALAQATGAASATLVDLWKAFGAPVP